LERTAGTVLKSSTKVPKFLASVASQKGRIASVPRRVEIANWLPVERCGP